MTDSDFRKTVEVEADSLKEARKELNYRIPQGLSVLSEKIISDGNHKTSRGIAGTTDEAYAKAQAKVPGGAEIVGKKEISSSERKDLTIEAFDEHSAREQARNQSGKTAIIKDIKLITLGTPGFLGIGKKPNQYQVEVLLQAIVEITYKTKAKIVAELGKAKAKAKRAWTPTNPAFASHMPLPNLQRIFIFTDGDGQTVLDSPVATGMLQDTAEAPLEDFMGKVKFDVIARSNVASQIEQTRQFPESGWVSMSELDSVIAQKAREGIYQPVIRAFADPITGEQGVLVLIYRL
jgi:hypothetical protein